jgi:hypothetical protein
MNERESTLKALALIAAELHMQNLITISIGKGITPDYSYVSEILISDLSEHFVSYCKGGIFSPGSVVKIKVEVGR